MPERMSKNLNVQAYVMIDGYIWKELELRKFSIVDTQEGTIISLKGRVKEEEELWQDEVNHYR